MESTSAPPEALPLEVRKEVTRLRSIMYENTCVRLSTAVSDGGRWLTDQYVCLDVTDSAAVEGLEDGQYKLTAGRGLVRLYYPAEKDCDCGVGDLIGRVGGDHEASCALVRPPMPRPSEFDTDAYFDLLAEVVWQRAVPSEWSVAEHPGKAMLLSAYGRPAFMGEETWTTLRRTFEQGGHEVRAEYATATGMNVFRILYGGPDAPEGVVAAYVAGIRCPEGQEEIASVIARLTESTSNRLEGAHGN